MEYAPIHLKPYKLLCFLAVLVSACKNNCVLVRFALNLRTPILHSHTTELVQCTSKKGDTEYRLAVAVYELLLLIQIMPVMLVPLSFGFIEPTIVVKCNAQVCIFILGAYFIVSNMPIWNFLNFSSGEYNNFGFRCIYGQCSHITIIMQCVEWFLQVLRRVNYQYCIICIK